MFRTWLLEFALMALAIASKSVCLAGRRPLAACVAAGWRVSRRAVGRVIVLYAGRKLSNRLSAAFIV